MLNTEDKGRQASIEGFANEHIVAGLLMKKYQNVSLVDLPLSPYDIIIVRKLEAGGEDIIRAQVKTARTSVSFTGGTRGGVDREYKSDVKTYTQSPKTSDVVIGLKPLENGAFDMYFIPTMLIAIWGTKSKGLGTIEPLKNNYYILENCKNKDLILNKCKEYEII
ncbi:MAG: hypothetical protein A2161_11220 [Candidatus Schekmanbacteria bacterium RBG_13_48_7]|uniref:PD(D/E)XK endonuclease domain-containing protein n=1 Tax=Candidatus Schekmanbacteria bacterium RBG_13_48_7 TaxID=1817878 RepID=A0A1F7RST9_9BACT|nr:MAG: hypothetical protein A2161_11220 [Candidatus Schekmanbacteria bacterium RBG_13_48_7]